MAKLKGFTFSTSNLGRASASKPLPPRDDSSRENIEKFKKITGKVDNRKLQQLFKLSHEPDSSNG